MAELKKYKSAGDFRQALEGKVRATWRAQPGTQYQDHTRIVAFERCLARFNPLKTTLKGGYALEFRLTYARLTKDMDLTITEEKLLIADKDRQAEAIRDYVQDLLQQDLDDYFTFEIKQGAKHLKNAEGGGTRLTVIAKVDGRVFREFHIDIEIRKEEILPSESHEGQNSLSFAGIPNPTVSLTPNEVMFAEKLNAYTAEWNDRENTRVKDIVDLNCLLDQNLDHGKIHIAIDKVFQSRQLPKSLAPPPDAWLNEYNKLASQVNLNLDLNQAYERLNNFYKKIQNRDQ
jgi:hypothetical protein